MYDLKIALQKSGRLHDESINILKNCGINFDLNLQYKLKIETFIENINGKIQIFFLRDDDIPKYVQKGIATIGIVGKNVVFEQKKDSLIKEYLDFGFCRLSLAVHKESLFLNVKDLFGKCIATSYPNILKSYLNKQFSSNHEIMIHSINGSVEIAPNIGVADAIFDLVSSGKTLALNDLKEIQKIFASQAVLICSDNNNVLANILISQIQAVKKAKDNKYILFNIPNKKLDKIISFFHKEKCTVTRVDLIDSSCTTTVKVVVQNNVIWKIIEELKINNAKNLLVFPIQKYF
jgi:ATP phosphoribosyltransferase